MILRLNIVGYTDQFNRVHTHRRGDQQGGPSMPSISQLIKEWQEAKHVAEVIGGRKAAAAAEAARQALAKAVKKQKKGRR